MGKLKAQAVEEAEVRDSTAEGKGVAEIDGKAIFVPFALAGERVQLQRVRRKKSYDEAELVSILRKSPERVEPPCPVFGVCGGCSLQHMSAAAQLQLKHTTLVEALKRLGQVDADEIASPLAGGSLAYRRRARFGIRFVPRKNRLLVGFRERNKSYIVDMQDCAMLVPELARLLPLLPPLLARLKIAQRVPQIELSAGDAYVSLVFRVLDPPGTSDRACLAEFAAREGLQIWLQPGGPESLEALDASDQRTLSYRLDDYNVNLQFGPLDFIQINAEMNRRMITQALEWLNPQPGEQLLDLFCGIGNFSLPLARIAGHVTGVEFDSGMVARAASNAAINGITNAGFAAADLTQAGNAMPTWATRNYDAVLLDPPRNGAREALPLVAATGARRLLYVSCHPGSLARDAGLLVREHGYRLRRVGAMDMFPQTGHAEAMALFIKE